MNRLFAIAITLVMASPAAFAQSQAASQAGSAASSQAASQAAPPSGGWPLIIPGDGTVQPTPSGVIYHPTRPTPRLTPRATKSVSASYRAKRSAKRAHWQTRVYHWNKRKHR